MLSPLHLSWKWLYAGALPVLLVGLRLRQVLPGRRARPFGRSLAGRGAGRAFFPETGGKELEEIS